MVGFLKKQKKILEVFYVVKLQCNTQSITCKTIDVKNKAKCISMRASSCKFSHINICVTGLSVTTHLQTRIAGIDVIPFHRIFFYLFYCKMGIMKFKDFYKIMSLINQLRTYMTFTKTAVLKGLTTGTRTDNIPPPWYPYLQS